MRCLRQLGHRFARQKPTRLHFTHAVLERRYDERHVRFRVRRRQEARPTFPDVHPFLAQVKIQEAAVFDLVVEARVEHRREILQVQRHTAFREEAIEFAHHLGGAFGEPPLQSAALALEMVQNGPRGRHRQRMPDVRAREKRHADLRE